jgi:putative ABC transport system permease protein
VVRAIYGVDKARHPGTHEGLLFFNYDYLNEAVGGRAGHSMYKLLIEDPGQAGSVSRAVDDTFENADPPTRTETEAAFRAGLVSMAGNLALLLRGTEIAVLKTVGFPNRLVMGLVLGEALFLSALGGGLGLLLGRIAIHALPRVPLLGDAVMGFPNLGLIPGVAALGMGLALLLGFFAGLFPALGAYRARIADMLRDV